MRIFAIIIVVCLITIILETLAFVGIGELFNLIYKKSKFELSLGRRLFIFLGESLRLARKIKNSSEALEPDFIAEMNRTPLSVIIALFLVIVWCITGIVTYVMEFNVVLIVLLLGVEFVIAIVVGKLLSDKKKDEDSDISTKCMKCKVLKLTTYHTIRLRHKTFATIHMPNGSRYKMIPVENYEMRSQREKSVDIDMYCVVYYDYLPFAKCVIDKKALSKLRL